ncbi:MAG: glycerophosphodiester phosphodiesterase family protein, partial [Anaerovorax sp.]
EKRVLHHRLPMVIILVVCGILWMGAAGNSRNLVFASQGDERAAPTIIAHGGGIYREFETSNSVEALLNAIENGITLIELDLSLTSDGKIIMLHDWNRTVEHYLGDGFDKKLSLSQFEAESIFGTLEPLTFDKLTKSMTKYPNIKIITDTKEDTLLILEKISTEYPEYRDRIIPQIYDEEEWLPVKNMGYEDIIFTVYLQAEPKAKELVTFAKEKHLYGVTMPDYEAKKGLCKAVSSQGIPVFVHPVNGMEDARLFMDMGATGIYSGTLLPEEFQGFEKNHYLTVKDETGKFIKLTDATITIDKPENLMKNPNLRLMGLEKDEKAQVSLDDQGKKLTITVFSKTGEEKGKLTYSICMFDGKMRIVENALGYRLEAEQKPKEFQEILDEKDEYGQVIDEEVRTILESSLIAKTGEHIYYGDGKGFVYKNGQNFFPVRGGVNGRFQLPLADTMTALGADSVYMTDYKDLVIAYEGERYTTSPNSYYLSNSYQLFRLKSPTTLYLRKFMADPEFFCVITKRSFIAADGVVIILPKGVAVSKDLEKQLLAYGKKLF